MTIDKHEWNQLIALAEKGPIPVEINRDIMNDCIKVGITNLEYIKASNMLLGLNAEVKRLQEYKEWAEVQLDADREAFSRMEHGKPCKRFIVVNYVGLTGEKQPETFKAHHLEFSRDKNGAPISIFEREDGGVGFAPVGFIQFYDGYAEEEEDKS